MAHLVFQTAFPGDLFLSIPLLKRIREWDPQTPLVIACRPGLGEFFVRSGLVDQVIEIDKRSPEGRRLARKKLRSQKWDVIFVPHESVRTALWLWLVQARKKIGFYKWWNFPFYSQRVRKPMDFPDALRQLSLLTPVDDRLAEAFGGDEIQTLRSPLDQKSSEDFRTPVIPESVSMLVRPRTKAAAGLRRIFLAPGSVWATKRWTLEGYTELAELLLKRGYKVELIGAGAEKILCDQIAAKVPGVVNRAGLTTLNSLVDLFTEGSALVCNDSGAMHAAAAAGLPTVAVFGPTVLAQGFRPWQNSAVVVQRELGCRPCGKHGAKECPIGTHECMKAISANEVLSALEALISKPT